MATVLPAAGVVLKEFDLNATKLRVAFELGPQVQRSAVVRELQAGGWFTRISEAQDNANRGWTVFDIDLAAVRRPPGTPIGAVASQPVFGQDLPLPKFGP
jgi:hypothetical protein